MRGVTYIMRTKKPLALVTKINELEKLKDIHDLLDEYGTLLYVKRSLSTFGNSIVNSAMLSKIGGMDIFKEKMLILTGMNVLIKPGMYANADSPDYYVIIAS